VLHHLRGKAIASPPAWNGLIALSYSGAQAAKLGGVAGAPGPATGVVGVVITEGVAAGLAEPGFCRAGARGAVEGWRGEGCGLA
jgi:hypothetical protein